MQFFGFSDNVMASDTEFDPNCTRCSRLSGYLDGIRLEYPTYHASPVAPFGSVRAKLLVVGLAPGLHGANASGRPFTGDHAGILLYQTLFNHGFSNKPVSLHVDDGLKLKNCRITNAVKCVPPQNKPTTAEIHQCNVFLQYELGQLKKNTVLVCLGGIAHRAVLRALGLKMADYPFAHHAVYHLDNGLIVIDSYHCSRYNTQTRRLTAEMFDQVFATAKSLIGATTLP